MKRNSIYTIKGEINMKHKALLLAIVLVFALSVFALPALAADYVALDLSNNQTSYALNATGTVEAYGVDAAGDKTRLTEGVTFASSDPSVIQIDAANGSVTAKSEGMAVITATSGSLSKNINLVVYKERKANKNFDTAATYNHSCPQGGTFTFADPVYAQSDMTRTGEGQSLFLRSIATGSNQEDTKLTQGKWIRMNPWAFSNGSNAASFRGVAEMWFYDGMEESKKYVHFWIMGNQGNGFSTQSIRGYIRLYSADNVYRYQEDGTNPAFTKTDIPRSKGWHQLIIDYSKNDLYTLYIDGEVLATRDLSGWNQGISGVEIDRTPQTSGADNSIYLDDFNVYSIQKTEAAAPQIRNAVIAGNAYTGQELLLSSYSYHDENGDPEDAANVQIKWYVSSNQSDWGEPVGTGKTYSLTAGDAGKYVKATVQAKSTIEPYDSNVIESNIVGPVEVPPDIDNMTFTSISLGKSVATYAYGETGAALTVWGTSSAGDYEISGDTRLTYESGDENVVSVDASGAITIKGLGTAVVTATLTNKDASSAQASVLVSVLPSLSGARKDFNNPNSGFTKEKSTFEDKIVRTGAGAVKVHSTSVYVDCYNDNTNPSTSYIAEGWFYDSGEKANAKAQIQFSSNGLGKADGLTDYSIDVGLTDDTKDYYYAGSTLLDGKDGRANLPRTKGWHQVTLIGYNDDPSPASPKTVNNTQVYIDGVLVSTSTTVYRAMHYVRARGLYNDATGTIGSIYDDLSFLPLRRTNNVDLTVTIAGNGKVLVDEQEIATGEKVTLPFAGSKTITFKPDAGWQTGEVTVNNQAAVVTNDTLELKNIQDTTAISVTFVEKTEEKPSFAQTSAPIAGTYPQGSDQYCATMFANMNEGYGYTVLKKGVEIYAADDTTHSLPLEVDVVTDGKYGVRVFGAALIPGKTYVMRPFVVVQKDGETQSETIYAQPQTFTVPQE